MKKNATSQAPENDDATAGPADVDAAGNQILYHQSDIRITANGLDSDGATDSAIPVTIENGCSSFFYTYTVIRLYHISQHR